MQLGSGIAVALAWQAATALIRPLAWEPPYAAGAALEKAKRQKEKKKKKKKDHKQPPSFLVTVLPNNFPNSFQFSELFKFQNSRSWILNWVNRIPSE